MAGDVQTQTYLVHRFWSLKVRLGNPTNLVMSEVQLWTVWWQELAFFLKKNDSLL